MQHGKLSFAEREYLPVCILGFIPNQWFQIYSFYGPFLDSYTAK
jgi:hypothetical protein